MSVSIMLLQCENATEKSMCDMETTPDSISQTYNVLFIGNSFTAEIPSVLQRIASSKGDSLFCMASTPGGYDFKGHSFLPETINAIKLLNWDMVILQESGWKSAIPESMADTMIYPFADSLCRMIRANTENAKILFYLPHAYKDGAEQCPGDSGLCTYSGMQKRMRECYLNLSQKFNAPVIPVGIIWFVFQDTYPSVNLYAYDRDHANQSGSYLDACAIYSYIYHKRPDQVYVSPGVEAEIAQKIQKTFSNVLFDCNPSWVYYRN